MFSCVRWGLLSGHPLGGWAPIVGRRRRRRAGLGRRNFFSIYGTSDLGIWACNAFMGGPPHERAEIYRRCSPISYAHQCTTPTLFLQHENDYRSPPEQTEQFYAILKAQGVSAETLRFPGTSHGRSVLGPVTHRRAQNEALLDWMNRYVRDRERPEPDQRGS